MIALLANLGTAFAKLIAAVLTGSNAMWAETFHAFADSGNELLLLTAERRSRRPPDDEHPLGHGRAAYFWALIASLGVFGVGALLSLHQGVEGLMHPERIESFRVAYGVLLVSFCLDGASLLQAQRQLKADATSFKRTFYEQLDLGSDPVVRAVFAEDAAALIGDVVALVGIAIHHLTGSAIPDGIAALTIGILLGFVALQLAARNGDILIGGQAPAALRGKTCELIASQPGIVAVTELLMTFIGPRRVWVVARVFLGGALNGASVAKLVSGIEIALQRDSSLIARVDIVPYGLGQAQALESVAMAPSEASMRE